MHGETLAPEPWQRTLGIVGGLGPHAHIRFEQLLLRAAEARVGGRKARDQDYPPHLVVSLPGTPDRTEFLAGRGSSPLPWLERSLRTLEGVGSDRRTRMRADFAVIACHTAHALVPELVAMKILPILDIAQETVARVSRRPGVRTVGLLATTGTLGAGIFQRRCDAHGLSALSPLDLPDGEALQRSLVMDTIYGTQGVAGIKSGAHRVAADRDRLRARLERAAHRLAEAGAQVILAACTEIPLVLPPGTAGGIEVLDPLEIAASAALEIAAGERELPAAT